jgi:hypothetical protein
MNWQIIFHLGFPGLPLAAYILLMFSTIQRQVKTVPDRIAVQLDSRMNINLTLLGFSFTVLGLLVSLFPKELVTVRSPIELLAVALTCFLSSYILLYLRLWRAFETGSDALTTSGIWATIGGMRELFRAFPVIAPLGALFTGLLAMLALFVLADIYLRFTTLRREHD